MVGVRISVGCRGVLAVGEARGGEGERLEYGRHDLDHRHTCDVRIQEGCQVKQSSLPVVLSQFRAFSQRPISVTMGMRRGFPRYHGSSTLRLARGCKV